MERKTNNKNLKTMDNRKALDDISKSRSSCVKHCPLLVTVGPAALWQQHP